MINTSNKRPVHIIGSPATESSELTNAPVARYIHDQLSAKGETSHLHLGTATEIKGLTGSLAEDPNTQIIFFVPSTNTPEDARIIAELQGSLRSERKDLYLILASETSGASPEEQYFKGLDLMKSNHANLVFAYDQTTQTSMVVVPEEAHYGLSSDRKETLDWLIKIALARAGESFTRSHVIDAPSVSWNSPQISQNFRTIVDHLVDRGAYKKFRGKTAGHFAIRGTERGEFLTSRRNNDFNMLSDIGLVRVFANGRDEVTAHGSKPSVGGQSQRIIFDQHPDLANIVHFHSPLRTDGADMIPVREQWPFECGSHQCGQNTADGLREVVPGIYAVMLENHGPNIVFGNEVPAGRVIDLIERNFDLEAKTGYAPDERYQGRVASPYSLAAFNAG